MAMSDRAFRALATREPEVVIATLRAVIPTVLRTRTVAVTPDDLRPTRLDAIAPPRDIDWLAAQDDDWLLHLESQGYRDVGFPDRVFFYHLWLVVQHPRRVVRTVALWFTDPPAREARGEVERNDVRVRVSNVIVPRVPAEALLEDPACACFAAGADRGAWSVKELCARVARVLRESDASWNRRHMAVVAAATQGRYKEMVEAMQHENLEPVIIEDLVHIGEDLGYSKGHTAGQSEGYSRGQRAMLVQILTSRGVALTAEQQKRLDACDDAATLTRWAEHALRGEDPGSWLG